MEPGTQMDVAAMVVSATAMVKVVMALLGAMSVLSWAIIFWKLATLARASRAAEFGAAAFDAAGDLDSGLAALDQAGDSPVSAAAKAAGPRAAEISRRALTRILRQSGERSIRALAGSLGFLATTASSAPFIGLFGTVWGIMHAFSALGHAQSVTLALVAPGIAEALVTTAMGLFTAIPALLAFNAFSGMLDRLDDGLEDFIESFMDKSRPACEQA